MLSSGQGLSALEAPEAGSFSSSTCHTENVNTVNEIFNYLYLIIGEGWV